MSALLCRLLYYARRFSEAVQVGLKAVASNPDSCIAHAYLAHAMLLADMQSRAMRHFEQARILSDDSKVYLGFWAYACGVLGMRKEAEEVLNKLLSLPNHDYVPSYFIALTYVGLGQDEGCLDWLKRASEERSPWVLFMNSDPIFDRIRSDGRFRAILEKVGLPRLSPLAVSKAAVGSSQFV